MDGRRLESLTISSPWAFGSGELKMMVLYLFDNKSFPLQNSLTLHAGKYVLMSADIFQN